MDEVTSKEINRLTEMGQKVYSFKYDFFKFFATLSSGAILFISAFLSGHESEPAQKGLIIISMFMFFLSMVTSIGAMLFASHQSIIVGLMTISLLKHNEAKSDKREILLKACKWAATLSFIIAILLVGTFFLLSF
jgi:hypothetical protein